MVSHFSEKISAQNQQPFGRSGAAAVDLLATFECPVCMGYMLPPYLQCPNGHLVSNSIF
jgi:E3 ubiquitin-protein ligase SIAH1